MYQLIDFKTKKPVFPNDFVFMGEDSPWEVCMNLQAIREKLSIEVFKNSPPNIVKYLPLLPIKDPAFIESLSNLQIATPLVRSRRLGQALALDLYFKVEGKNLTGSFKDRGSIIDVSIAKELGAKAIVLASTGNMAASCACFASMLQIPCYVLVNEEVPMAKLAQVMAFGAKVLKVKGSFNDAAQLAKQVAKKIKLYLAGDYAFRIEGQKTAIFEIMDQLAFEVPDVIIVPMGCGTNIASYAKGLHEYHQLGLIDKLPQLIGVQAEGSDAIVRSFLNGDQEVFPLDRVDTVASAIAVPSPIDGIKALAVINATKGLAIAVSDEEIFEAKYELSSKEGLFVESASATTLAALKKLVRQKNWQAKKVLCVLSGDGLKDPNVVLEQIALPPVIDANVEAFIEFYNSTS